MIESHIALAIALFFITNWIGHHSIHVGYIQLSILAKVDEAPAFNFIYRAFSPVAFITIAAAALYGIGADWVVQDIYLVVVYYFVIRIAFNLATGKARLLNWAQQFAYVAVSVPASYYIYHQLIVHKEFLFPSPEDLGTAVWLGIAAYIYHTANSIRSSGERTKARKLAYLKNRFDTYNKAYGDIVRNATESKQQELLIMAVIIYEAFNRPRLYRAIENMLFHVGYAKTLGIMQVTTSEKISDEESVRLGSRKIVNDHQAALFSIKAKEEYPFSWAVRREVIASYNRDGSYVDEVLAIYEQLVDMYAPEAKDDSKAEWARYQESAKA